MESVNPTDRPSFDPTCYLCPGNVRANGETNPAYEKTFVFTNDHAAMLPEAPEGKSIIDDLFISEQERGICRVVCYTPLHNKTMSEMKESEITNLIATWTKEYETIGNKPFISYVQIFENKGSLMGASSPHPHSQIWANEHIPTIPAKEQEAQKTYVSKHKKNLLLTYLEKERKENKRIVFENNSFIMLIPFWAVWPYETMIIPKEHKTSLRDLNTPESQNLAETLSKLTRLYDRLFHTSFPYSMGIHQAPTDKKNHTEWQMHIHFYPPLLRSATIKKHYVGYEMMAEAQRDISPEEAAATLRRFL